MQQQRDDRRTRNLRPCRGHSGGKRDANEGAKADAAAVRWKGYKCRSCQGEEVEEERMSDPMRVSGRVEPALWLLRFYDLACTHCLEKRGQMPARTNPPIFMYSSKGRGMTYLGAAGAPVETHSVLQLSNRSLTHHDILSSPPRSGETPSWPHSQPSILKSLTFNP